MALRAEELTEEEPPEWTLGERFAKARSHRGVKSTKEMASLLSTYFGREIKPSTVGAWERMDNKPTKGGISQLDVVRAYSEILRVPEAYFLTRSRCFSLLPPMIGQGTLFDDEVPPPRSLAAV